MFAYLASLGVDSSFVLIDCVKLGRGLLNKLKMEIPTTKVTLLVLLSSYLLWKVVETLHGISGLLV